MRRKLDETRERILDAGAVMVAEAGYSLDSANISLIDACRRAGLSTAGSGYKIWPTQEDFRRDLIHHTLTVNDAITGPARRVVGSAEGPESTPDLDEVIRVSGNDNADSIVRSANFTRLIALWVAASADEQLRDGHLAAQRTLLESLEEVFRSLMVRHSLEMRPPFTLAQLTHAIVAQMQGLGVLLAYGDEVGAESIMRPTGPGGTPQRWHLVSCAVQALVTSFTRPAGTADQE